MNANYENRKRSNVGNYQDRGRFSNPYGGKNYNDCDVSSFQRVLEGSPLDVTGLKDALNSYRDNRGNFKGGCYKPLKNVIHRHFNSIVNEIRSNFFKAPPEKRLEWAVKVAIYLMILNLKTTQVRKVLEMVREIKLEFRGQGNDDVERIKTKLTKLRFLLAYSVGKADKDAKALEAVHRTLDPLVAYLSLNPDKGEFDKFYDFVEAIIAYHRFFGGREK